MRKRHISLSLALILLAATSFLVAADPEANKEKVRQEYKAKTRALGQEHLAARMELARWCLDQDLLEEAQAELCFAQVIDPQDARLLPLWSDLASKTKVRPVTISVTLADGNVVKGVSSPKPFVFQQKYGFMLLPLQDIRSLKLLETGGKTTKVSVQTLTGTFEGILFSSPIQIKGSLGDLTIPFEKVTGFVIEEAGNAQQPPKQPGQSELDWDTTLSDLKVKGLDVVIVFDSTGSMQGIIHETKSRIRQLMQVVTHLVPDARLGLVTYRDKKEFDLGNYEYTVKSMPLTKDVDSLQKWLDPIKALGGGDIPEAVYEGLQTAIQKGGWRKDSKKIIIILGDAPPRPENDGLNKTYDFVKRWHDTTGGIVSCIDTGGASAQAANRVMDEFKQIATNAGGDATFLNNDRDIIKQLVVYIFGSKWKSQVEKALDDLAK